MTRIFGKYKYEKDENMEAFNRTLGYIEMIGVCDSEFEISRQNEKWIIRSVTAGKIQYAEFDPINNQYIEIRLSGHQLKCEARQEGDFLVIEADPDCLIVRKCQFTEDGAIFTIGKVMSVVAVRYFKRDCEADKSEIVEESSSSTSQKSLSTSQIATIAGATTAVIGVGVGIVAAPLIVTAAGFTAGGIAAGSLAASMMSVLGGGATAAGGVVATLQSVGALGTVLGSVAATAAAAGTGAAAGAAVGAAINAGNTDTSANESEKK